MLKAVVIGLGALIVIALAFVVIGIVSKLGGQGAPASQAGAVFALAPGASIVEMQSQAGRLILRVHTQQGDEIDIIDTDDGHLVAKIK
jgi:hypothetical protein